MTGMQPPERETVFYPYRLIVHKMKRMARSHPVQEVMCMPIFENQATLSYNNMSVNSNIVRGEVAESLIVEKAALSPTYSPHDKVTFTISIRNTGTSENTYAVSDDLGAYDYRGNTFSPLTYVNDTLQLFVNGELQPIPAVYGTSPLVIPGITVPAGGSAVIIYSAYINGYAPVCTDACITNTVSVTSEGPCSAEAHVCISPAAEPVLSIEKTLMPCRLSDCTEPVCYTITISNSGPVPAVATDNAVISDRFDPVLNITSVSFNGNEWSEGMHYTYNEITGEFATIPGQITIPAASFTRNPETCEWIVTPGTATLVIHGNY